MTVVKKVAQDFETPDDYLPSVMTCQKNLKIPDYTSYDVFKQKFMTAINEGTNAFHLS
jgi:E3 ubiquitin-protein ligase TRIP12